jgi:hypothetical protein
MVVSSVVIDDFDFVGITFRPRKTQPPLVIDANAPLAFSISFQGFQPVLRWHPQILDAGGAVEHLQLALGNVLKRLPLSVTSLSREQGLGVFALE